MSKKAYYASVEEMPRAEKPTTHNFMDLTGRVFGRLTVTHYAGTSSDPRPQTTWGCYCSCGALVLVASNHLRSGDTQSCGCLRRLATQERSTKHGVSSRTAEGNYLYRAYESIKRRCSNPKDSSYDRYGARGIRIDFTSFEEFYAYILNELGTRPDRCSLDRINNLGNYCPGNLRWATSTTQARNRRTNRLVTFGGVQMSLAEAASNSGVSYWTVCARLNRGWPEYAALHTPVGSRFRATPAKTNEIPPSSITEPPTC